MIERLRPKYTDEELKEIYSIPHSHHHWLDHKVRVRTTVALASVFLDQEINSIADLSCGDAYIPQRIADMYSNPLDEFSLHLGDFAPGYQYTGPIEETIKLIPEVDLYVCSETAEHADNPWEMLYQIRERSKRLIVSTPLDERINNPEHYYRWDKEGFLSVLSETGWKPKAYQELTFNYLNDYGYQMWACE